MRFKQQQITQFTNNVLIIGIICILANCVTKINCFESYELDLFDLVEELNTNFYDFFGVQSDCETNEIKKAYRKLSMQWHPDKNTEPNAEKMFRNIVGVYDVLKDTEKRERYNQILEFGLPDWRTPIYYYRRVRKLGFYELSILLSTIISIGHYFVLWAKYFETKLTLDDRLGEIRKRLEKKQLKKKKKLTFNSIDLDEMETQLQDYMDQMASPSLKDTLPCRFAKWLFYFCLNLPTFVKQKFFTNEKLKKRKKRKNSENDNNDIANGEEESDDDDEEESETEEEKARALAKKQQQQQQIKDLNPTKIEKSDISKPVLNYNVQSTNNKEETVLVNANSEWTDKDKQQLIKAIAKFPPGTASRWLRIAEQLSRSQSECIKMDKQIRSSITGQNATFIYSNLNAKTDWSENKVDDVLSEKDVEEEEIKLISTSDQQQWSQGQQIALEKALKQYGKDVDNRWEKIASCVVDKNAQQCIERYKNLCEALKKK